jgi:imidazole glycerol-phosphate synthase subunit HisF
MRLIARLDIKWPNLIKGIHLEGLRIIGNPSDYAKKYYEQYVDEIIYMDSVASLYGRNSLLDLIVEVSKNVFVPMTVGGGIRSVQDARMILRSGADKIAVNTEAIKRPKLIEELASMFGSQCIVLSIEAKKQCENKWIAYTDSGRERSNYDVLEWAKLGVSLGAGEILLTSVDCEGTQKGFDIDLNKAVSNEVNVPVIASGGMGSLKDISVLNSQTKIDAIAMASMLHYGKTDISKIRTYAKENAILVRV